MTVTQLPRCKQSSLMNGDHAAIRYIPQWTLLANCDEGNYYIWQTNLSQSELILIMCAGFQNMSEAYLAKSSPLWRKNQLFSNQLCERGF